MGLFPFRIRGNLPFLYLFDIFVYFFDFYGFPDRVSGWMDRLCRVAAPFRAQKVAAQEIPGGRRAGKRAARRDGGLLAWMGGKRLRDKGWLAWIVNR